MTETNLSNQTLEEDILDDNDDLIVDGVDIIHDCLCLACGGGRGVTRMMIHKIPYFRELVIASFHCPDCYERNNEVSFGGEIQSQGQRQTLHVTLPSDLDRQIIKSDSASLRIEEIDFEMPAMTQKGSINTIEGFLRIAAKDLGELQGERYQTNPDLASKLADIILELTMMAAGSDDHLPFTIILDDPAGNSYIQNPFAPAKDPNLSSIFYTRTAQQDESLGLKPADNLYKDDKETHFTELIHHSFGADASSSVVSTSAAAAQSIDHEEAISIPSACPNCLQMGNSLTAMTHIPHFKEVLIMAFTCEFCGFRNNEVKGGGAVPDRGTEVRLLVTSTEDLKRDILKSDSSKVIIPELDLELQHGTLGGFYTTVEGLLDKIHKSLTNDNPFAVGDSVNLHHSAISAVNETKQKFMDFLAELQSYAQGKKFPFNLIIRDPLGNSFISAPLGSFLPPELDKNLTIEDFVRSYEENEEFGLNDINTKDYEVIEQTEEYYGPILPDRVTYVVPKGADHPTFYAKATEDDITPGGQYISSSTRIIQQADSVFVETENNTTVTTRRFNEERDLSLEFMPYEEFSGRKPGYVFRLGAKGLGYYQDRPIEAAPLTTVDEATDLTET